MQCISHYLYARFILKFEVNSLYLSGLYRTNKRQSVASQSGPFIFFDYRWNLLSDHNSYSSFQSTILLYVNNVKMNI